MDAVQMYIEAPVMTAANICFGPRDDTQNIIATQWSIRMHKYDQK